MIPKTQKEYFELSHHERKKVPASTLIDLLGEKTAEEDPSADYYPLSEAFDAMTPEARSQLTKDQKMEILNERPQQKKENE